MSFYVQLTSCSQVLKTKKLNKVSPPNILGLNPLDTGGKYRDKASKPLTYCFFKEYVSEDTYLKSGTQAKRT